MRRKHPVFIFIYFFVDVICVIVSAFAYGIICTRRYIIFLCAIYKLQVNRLQYLNWKRIEYKNYFEYVSCLFVCLFCLFYCYSIAAKWICCYACSPWTSLCLLRFFLWTEQSAYIFELAKFKLEDSADVCDLMHVCTIRTNMASYTHNLIVCCLAFHKM